MDRQIARDKPVHTSLMSRYCHQARNNALEVKRNGRSSSFSCKREMPDGHQTYVPNAKLESARDVFAGADFVDMMSGKGDAKLRQLQRLSPEAEAGAWLRDEPVDASTGSVLVRSGASPVAQRECGGAVSSEDSMDIDGSQFLTEIGRCGPDLIQDFSVARGDALSSRWATSPGLAALMKSTKIKEATVKKGVESCGGGQKGLKSFAAMILVWLRDRDRVVTRSSDRFHANPDCWPGFEEIESQRPTSGPWSAYSQSCPFSGHGKIADNYSRVCQGDLNYELNSMPALTVGSENLSNLSLGGSHTGDYGQVRNYETQHHMFIGERGSLGGVLDQGLGSQGSGSHPSDVSPTPSGAWVSSLVPPERLQRAGIRKLSPSPDRSESLNSPDSTSYDSGHFHQKKIQRGLQSPPANSSSQGSTELPPIYGSSASSPVSDSLTPPGIFGSFSPGGLYNPSPASPPSIDLGSFNTFGLQGQVLTGENLSVYTHGFGLTDRSGSFGVLPENPRDPEHSGDRLMGVIAKAKDTPAASTRLARKIRKDRNNRKVASQWSNRNSVQAGAVGVGGNSGTMWAETTSSSPRSFRGIHQSEAFPSNEGQCSSKDRRDQEHLEFLLQKVLRPSDVGNLGRIVLPKKDAENRLPWLPSREGMPFPCEDYDTGENVMLRYRFWPNNKSRMYLLENTGDFVKSHLLQESDRLLLYKHHQHGTYIIRGRKARDCVDVVTSLHTEEIDGEGKEISSENSPGVACSSGASSNGRDLETPDPALGSGLEVPSKLVATHGTTLIVTDYLPDEMSNVDLVRFPSIESFDVEALELAQPVGAENQDAKSVRFSSGEG